MTFRKYTYLNSKTVKAKNVLLILFLFLASIFFAQNNQFVVGYMPTYSNFPNAINNADLNILTHVDIAFVNPDANANIYMPNGTATVVNIAHAKNVKVLASIWVAKAWRIMN